MVGTEHVHSSVEASHGLVPMLCRLTRHQVLQLSGPATTGPGMLEHSPVLLAVGGLGGLGPAVWLHTTSAVGVQAEIVLYPLPQVLHGSHCVAVWFGYGWK